MGKAIRNVFKTSQFSLTECTDGYYLWDTVLQMNVAMHEKTERDAMLYALEYYQKRLAEIKKDYKELDQKVESFVSQFIKTDEYYEN